MVDRENYYSCEKCGYVAKVKTEEELKEHYSIHSKKCDGELNLSQGKCLAMAFSFMVQHPNLLFCYSEIPGRIKGQKLLHAWNESKGCIKDNGLVSLKIIPGKEIFDFVADYSDLNRKVLMKKEDYYKTRKIKESEVKKLNFRKLLKTMSDYVNKKQDQVSIWGWID